MTCPRRFDLIVFDWDGTLFDSTALIARCIQAACADLGTPVPSDRDASYVIGLGLNEALQHAAPHLPPGHRDPRDLQHPPGPAGPAAPAGTRETHGMDREASPSAGPM